MAISLTGDGLRLDYRTETQSSVSGTYPIGTVVVSAPAFRESLTLPGTWANYCLEKSGYSANISSYIGSQISWMNPMTREVTCLSIRLS